MPSPTFLKPAVRACIPCTLVCFLVLVTMGAGAETALPPGISPPPPPYTKAVDPSDWILDVLRQLYPGREWSKLQAGSDNLNISAAYTLKEPEYLEIKDHKTPDGRDLRPFDYMPVVFARQCRPAGDHGQLKVAGVTWVAYPGGVANRGHFSLSGEQDTPDDTTSSVGVSLGRISENKRVIDVGGPLFAENYPKWIQQHGQYLALLNSRKATQWVGAIAFPRGQVRLRLAIQGRDIELSDEQGKPIWERISVHINDFYDFDVSSDDNGLVRIVNPVLKTSDNGAAMVQEYVQTHANPFAKSDDHTISSLMLIDLRIKIIDASTIRVSSLGIPETIFHKLP